MPVDPQLIDVFGDDLGGILKAVEEGLNPQVQQLMAESLNTLQFDARIFADQIEKRVSMLAGAGMDEAAIRQILHNDMKTGGRIFGELRNNVKGGMAQSINQSGRAGQMEAYKPTEILAWVTVGGHKVCPDCDARAGQTGTIEFWETNGLPGSGWSVCQGFCYCILDPTGKIDKKVKAPEKIKPEKGATIRKPKPGQKWKPTMTTKEAMAWSKNSQVEGILYHGAPADALKGIGKKGFDLSKRATGRLYGDGAYFTRNTAVAQGYGDGKMGSFMINSKKHLTFDGEEYWQIVSGEVSNKSQLSSGHKFMAKARVGALDDIAESQAKKWKYKNPDGSIMTGQQLKNARLNDMKKHPGMQSGDRYITDGGSWNPEMSSKWFDYLETEYYAGNKNVFNILETYAETGNMDDIMFMEEFGDEVGRFLQLEGHTSMTVTDVNLPLGFHKIDPLLTKDTYTIVFNPQDITMIQD